MEKQQNKTPEVRFPEFKDDWEHKQLNELLSVSKTKNGDLKYGKEDVLSVSGDFGIVNQIEHLGRSYAGASVHNYGVVELNQIVYTKSPLKANPYGIIKVNKHKAGIVSTLYAVYDVNEETDGEFIEYYFSLDANLNRYLRPLVRKGAKNDMKISNEYVLHDRIYAPQKKEQQRIANFFSTINKKLTQLQEKKDALELYKKGMMQQIFSQNLRFKDNNGQDFPEWEYLHGNKIFERISNKKHNSDLPILAISQELGAVPRELINYTVSVTENSISSYKVVDVGDFIISLRSFQGGIEYSNYRGICSPAYIILRPTIKIEDYFYKHYLKSYKYIQQLKSKLEGIRDGKMISYKYFSEIKIPYPNLEEQTKIANFFSKIDDKINTVNEKIEQTKEYKKGLLQKMFCN